MEKSTEAILKRLEALEKDNESLHKKVNKLIVEKYSDELIEVVQASNLPRLKQIIEEDGYPVNEYFSSISNNSDSNLLLFSVEQDKTLIVKYLCSLPSLDINAIEKKDHWNALMNAIKNQNVTIASYLFEKNININNQDVDGFTPLSIAIDTQNETLIRLILQQKPKEESIETVKSLIAPIENEEIKKLITDYFGFKLDEEEDKDDD